MIILSSNTFNQFFKDLHFLVLVLDFFFYKSAKNYLIYCDI